MAVQPGLCRTWSETPKTCFLTTRLICTQSEYVSHVRDKDIYNEPHCEKTGLRDFRSGMTQTGLYSHRRWLEVEADLGLCFPICKKPFFNGDMIDGLMTWNTGLKSPAALKSTSHLQINPKICNPCN